MRAPNVRERRKAVVYLTSGTHLLVFTEPDYPEAGTQPPGGTIHDDETPPQGAARELMEETGISVRPEDLTEIGFQNYEYEADGVRHLHKRHFFHADVSEPVERRWTRLEENPDGADHEILFSLYWMPLNKGLRLFAGLDAFLPELLRRTGEAES
jgi:8-oxo-dGTP diphosphatase